MTTGMFDNFIWVSRGCIKIKIFARSCIFEEKKTENLSIGTSCIVIILRIPHELNDMILLHFQSCCQFGI